jgi:hypothetical protein
MAWTAHGIRGPRRRRGDWRSPPPPDVGAAHAVDRAAEPKGPDPWLVLSREIDRCRRYRHPLALVRVAADVASASSSLAARPRREGRASRRREDPMVRLAAALRGTLRSGDVAWVHGASAYVLAPETDACGAEAMGHRLRAVAADLVGASVELRIATFPEDGLTGHALRAKLTARARRFAPVERERRTATGGAWGVLSRVTDGSLAPELPEHAD